VATRATPLPPAERRASILRAVAPLLAEQGEGVTTKRLAEIAGVSEGTIFNVFDDKDDLIDAVVESVLDPEPLEQALAGIDPADAFEAQLVVATGLLQRRMIEIWRLFASLGARAHRHPRQIPTSPALTAIFASQPDRVTLPPDEAARRLRAVTMALTHPLMSPRPASPAEIVDAFLFGAASYRRRSR
jgi:AcrR family transcriptional regulator